MAEVISQARGRPSHRRFLPRCPPSPRAVPLDPPLWNHACRLATPSFLTTLPPPPSPILLQVSASAVVKGTVGLATATVATTYVLAVAKGDAPALPMISDTFVRAPESYVSRVGVVTVSAALQLVVWFLHAYLRRFAAPTPSWRAFALAHSLAGALAALALGVVGAISDVENLAAHFTSATVFFFAVLAWQIGYTVQLAFHPVAATRASVRHKAVCACVAAVALALFFSLAAVDFVARYRVVAACEWIVAVAVGASTRSLAREFDGEATGEARRARMELGSLWEGAGPGDPEMLDVLVPAEDDETRGWPPELRDEAERDA